MAKPKFQVGDTVRVKDRTTLFHTRTQKFIRKRVGTVVAHRPEWVIPEDEAWDRMETGRKEPFYVIRFKQTELWPDYTGLAHDTLETEASESWLESVKG
ncbi:Thiocyanate hydrolase subunit alpha [Nonomuraea coxensis DSM 45129]|uniref:Thiocyanate hydrolase subunit alpha n=1 Tax=Nonomuraea coxensis DSM 45129 TaxID=1122611 RepID=A0ABX8U6C1_9ACTN|nr:SH3-like domain-containing protein [Nonomuraea coxensis]QYC42192.1 Thiocyanate hydrolase subunit alpha [Nonomuraea coxensis DSM 45129]